MNLVEPPTRRTTQTTQHAFNGRRVVVWARWPERCCYRSSYSSAGNGGRCRRANRLGKLCLYCRRWQAPHWCLRWVRSRLLFLVHLCSSCHPPAVCVSGVGIFELHGVSASVRFVLECRNTSQTIGRRTGIDDASHRTVLEICTHRPAGIHDWWTRPPLDCRRRETKSP